MKAGNLNRRDVHHRLGPRSITSDARGLVWTYRRAAFDKSDYLLTIVDQYTRCVEAIPLRVNVMPGLG